jgi:phosphoglycolate phosphatase-like HAD superfamily hydrolase
LTGAADLREKIFLFDNDELLLVWESKLREARLKKEEEAWKKFEKELGKNSPKVTEAFVKWQEQLYTYIEQEKDRFLRERPGCKEGLSKLLFAGAKTIVVTKGAKPYTEKCFTLVGLSGYITDIYSPAPGKRDKRFLDAAIENGKDTTAKCVRDTVIVGHDAEKDMGWDLVPPKGPANDGNAPVLILFDALKFDGDVDAPLDALPEIVTLLAQRGKNDILRGFKTITKPEQAKTQNYTFSIALYHNPKRSDKARIPVVCNIKRRV